MAGWVGVAGAGDGVEEGKDEGFAVVHVGSCVFVSFAAEGFDGVKAGGVARGQVAEEDADAAGADDGGDDGAGRVDEADFRATLVKEPADAVGQRDAERAAQKAAKQAVKEQKKAEKKAAKAEKKREKNARFKRLFVDNGFTYYLDSKNSRWIPRPNSGSERIIEAWVRLVEDAQSDAADNDARPQKYFLEHYYISPTRREIMFISELEVTGRPENAIHERPYDAAHWERLVPGSIEDDLFDAIVARMKQAPGERRGVLSGTSGMSLRDMVEEYARISL